MKKTVYFAAIMLYYLEMVDKKLTFRGIFCFEVSAVTKKI